MPTLDAILMAHLCGSAPAAGTKYLGLVNLVGLTEATYSGYARLAVSSWSSTWSAVGGPWLFAPVDATMQLLPALYDASSGGTYTVVGTSTSTLLPGDAVRVDSFSVSRDVVGVLYGVIQTPIMNALLNHYFGIATYAAPTLYMFTPGGWEAVTFDAIANVGTNGEPVEMGANLAAYGLYTGPSFSDPLVTNFPGGVTAGGPVGGGTPSWSAAQLIEGRLRLTIDKAW